MTNKHVSLKDLAKELGVSISTVSRALKDHPDISPEMRQKVQQLAIARNYTPNPLAMGLLKQETKMIGVIIPDIVTHFYSSIISGIEEVAKEHGYYIIISSSYESYQKETESVNNLLKTRVEGLLVCISQETDRYDHFERLIDNDIPLVFFDRVIESLSVPSVIVDGVDASKKITQHLYNNGCRRIAYISGPEHLNISKHREEGYLTGLKECGLEFDKDLLIKTNLNADDATLATRKLLSLQKIPDAIYGINDTVAFAVMKEIKRQNLSIPKDIAVVGFTDDFHATVVDPPLTSVIHPTKEIGKMAASLFFERLNNNQVTNQVILKTKLVVRESSLRQKEKLA